MNDEREEQDPLNFPAKSGEEDPEITDETKEEDSQQLSLIDGFELQEQWQEEWQDMPEFIQEDLEPVKTLFVHFEDLKDLKEFSKAVDQKVSEATKSIWFPKADYIKPSNYVYTDES